MALVNPALQPNDLVERYGNVLALSVAGFDEDQNSYIFSVTDTLQGKAAADTLYLSLPSGEDPLMLRDGTPVVAFANKIGRRGADSVLLYVGNREWHEVVEEAAGKWAWQQKAPEAFSGTFNGDQRQLIKMIGDISKNTYFFPAHAFTRFSSDIEIAKFNQPLKGVALYDLVGDSRLDIVLASPDGIKIYEQQDSLQFQDVSTNFGLDANGSSLSLGDVDGDGDTDLLVDATLYLRNGASFEEKNLPAAFPEGSIVASTLVDINRDGLPDILVSEKQNGLHLFINQAGSSLSFKDSTEQSGLRSEDTGSDSTGYFAVGDWNGDQQLDILYATGRAQLLLQDESGQFSRLKGRFNADLRNQRTFEEGETGAGVFAPIWDAETTSLAIPSDSKIYLFIIDEERPSDVTGKANELGVIPSKLWGTLAEDLSANGNLDLFSVTRSVSDSSNVFHLNRGYGSFMYPERYETVFGGKAYVTGVGGITAGDVNEDGANDILFAGLDGRLVLNLNETLQLREETERPSYHQQKLLQTTLFSVNLRGKRGILGAEVTLKDKEGAVVARRVNGHRMPVGNQGPDMISLAVREPGQYTLEVFFSDGHKQEVALDTSKGAHQKITVRRED